MQLIVFTDIHGRFDLFANAAEEIREADLVVLAGDITHFGHREQMQHVLEILKKMNAGILAVTGNCDHPDAEDCLADNQVSLNRKYCRHGGYGFAGLSGSLPCPGTTPQEMSEQAYATLLYELVPAPPAARTEPVPLILVIHQPPVRTVCDRVQEGMHVGSTSVRDFIEKRQPLLCICGHIHEGTGIDRIGSTLIINPGPFRSGHYARIRLEGHKAQPELKKL